MYVIILQQKHLYVYFCHVFSCIFRINKINKSVFSYNLQTYVKFSLKGKSNIEWKQLWKIVHKCEKCIILKKLKKRIICFKKEEKKGLIICKKK